MKLVWGVRHSLIPVPVRVAVFVLRFVQQQQWQFPLRLIDRIAVRLACHLACVDGSAWN